MSERSEYDTAGGSDSLKGMPSPVQWGERLLTGVAGLILFTTMLMTTVDVIGRYAFNSPLGFAYEMTELLMATVVFIGLAPVTLRREHITIGLVNAVWSPRMRAIRDLVVAVIITTCMAYLCYRMFRFTGRFMDYSDRTNVLRMTLWPVAAIGAAGIGLAAIASLALVLDPIRRLIRGAG